MAIDPDGLARGTEIVKAAPWVHFGDGNNVIDMQLPPGQHRLTLQIGDDLHRTATVRANGNVDAENAGEKDGPSRLGLAALTIGDLSMSWPGYSGEAEPPRELSLSPSPLQLSAIGIRQLNGSSGGKKTVVGKAVTR